MALPEVNFTHELANWRQRLVKENNAAKEFMCTYDYLVWKHTPTHVHRPSASAKVKYYQPHGGWTVKDKRISLVNQAKDAGEEMSAEEVERLASDPATARDAILTCILSHNIALASSKKADPLFRTTSAAYGTRRPLEMFGVADHGIKATRSKEPVGNGTKIYYQ